MAEPWRKLADEAWQRWLRLSPPDHWPVIKDRFAREVLHDLARRVAEEAYREGWKAATCPHCRRAEPFKSRPAGAIDAYHVVAVGGGHTYMKCHALPLEPLPEKEG